MGRKPPLLIRMATSPIYHRQKKKCLDCHDEAIKCAWALRRDQHRRLSRLSECFTTTGQYNSM